ncbi:MAG: 16S rRNA (adenine(1518)-N(6)/adenine(1519)-N(6))-dimethyltransferase RsmA [Actinomycetales bacterium]
MTITLLGANEIRQIAQELDLYPKKSLGQNFVIDGNTCQKIVRLAGVTQGDHVVEIGPGLGSLTLAILQQTDSVTVIEIDQGLASRISQTVTEHGAGKLNVMNVDALDVREIAGSPNKLVANLPYNVSVPVLLHFLERFPTINSGIVMVQSEVADRLAATPGSKNYGAPSAKAAWWSDVSLSDSVSRKVFWPIPNVDSSLVAFKRHEPLGDEALRKATFKVIDLAFGKRRKMLRAALAELFSSSAAAESALKEIDIDPTLRGESLSVNDFLRIAKLVTK